MKKDDLELIAGIVRKRSGLVLTAEKEYLLDSRLSPLARKEGFSSIDDLITTLRTRRDEDLMWRVTEALTTNETFFFRDKTPFDLLREEILPEVIKARPAGGRLRIWSAACSSGQEAYSIAMVLEEFRSQLRAFQPEIIGTDICSKVLEKAKSGIFSQFEVQRGLPVKKLVEYFKKSGDQWQIDPRLQQHVTFKRFNLLDDFAPLGQFDIVFCRNVLIYFDQTQKSEILNRVGRQMQAGSHLVLGGSETVLGMGTMFNAVKGKRGLYRRPGAGGAGSTRAA